MRSLSAQISLLIFIMFAVAVSPPSRPTRAAILQDPQPYKSITYRRPEALRSQGLHNILQHMDDELAFASHIAKRGRVYQYVCRVPEDLGDAFPFAKVQRSLRTQDRATAYEAAARVHSEIEKRFAAARRRKGTTVNAIPVDDWDWTDWRQLTDWFQAVLLDEDWRMRLRNVPGAAFDAGVSRNQFWRDSQTVRAHIDFAGEVARDHGRREL